jgi:hypothetical protein
MTEALLAVAGALFTAAACYSTGAILLQWFGLEPFLRRGEQPPLAFLLGAAAVHLWMFALLALQAAYWPAILAPLAGATVFALARGLWSSRGDRFSPVGWGLVLIALPVAAAFFLVYFVHAWAPEHSPDGASYHLGILARQLRAHGFERITTNFYGMLSQGVELVFLPAFVIGKHSAAALTHLGFALALAGAIFNFGRRLARPWAGAGAAVLTLLSPVFGLTASTAYVDAATAAIVFAAFYWIYLWDREYEVHPAAWRLLAPAGLMAGYAYAAKYTAFTIGVLVVGVVAVRARQFRPLLLTAVCAALMAAPWAIRNWILYANPAAPLGNGLFRNPYTHVLFEQEYTSFLRNYQVEDKRTLPVEVTVRGERTQGLIGPIFLLLPLGLTALRRRDGRLLWAAAALTLSTYPANIGTRFLIPSLPFLALLIAWPLANRPVAMTALLAAHAVLSWPDVVPRYASRYAWRIEGFPWRAALRITPPEAYLEEVMPDYAVARLLERNVPPGEAVLAFGGLPDAYTTREVRVSFQSASNELLADIFHTGWLAGNQPLRVQVYRFHRITARRARIVQTAAAAFREQWSVHELRLYRNGEELPRRPHWRLRAWPNPWDVQLAFDNTGATRWRSWETAAPGMYLEIDFGGEEAFDEMRVETSPDAPGIVLRPEVKDNGGWRALEANLETRERTSDPQARRAATYELHQRGVHYILVRETDFGAADVRDDPEAWGLLEVASGGGARLYRTIW